MGGIGKIERDNGDELTADSLYEEVAESSMHRSKVLQNQKVLQEREEFEDLLGVQLKGKPLLIEIVILGLTSPVF